MSVAEMKKLIKEKVDHLNDEKALQQVLEVLSTTEKNEFIDVSKHADQLFSENDNLLKRLS